MGVYCGARASTLTCAQVPSRQTRISPPWSPLTTSPAAVMQRAETWGVRAARGACQGDAASDSARRRDKRHRAPQGCAQGLHPVPVPSAYLEGVAGQALEGDRGGGVPHKHRGVPGPRHQGALWGDRQQARGRPHHGAHKVGVPHKHGAFPQQLRAALHRPGAECLVPGRGGHPVGAGHCHRPHILAVATQLSGQVEGLSKGAGGVRNRGTEQKNGAATRVWADAARASGRNRTTGSTSMLADGAWRPGEGRKLCQERHAGMLPAVCELPESASRRCSPAMSAPGITVRTRKFMSNPLMQRKQFVRALPLRPLPGPATPPWRPPLTLSPGLLPPQGSGRVAPGEGERVQGA